MNAEKDLVCVFFFANVGSVTSKTCEAIMTQLKPFSRRDKKFQLWDRSMIPAGSNKGVEISDALQRCRVAVVLVSSEYLASEHWVMEVKQLVAAAKEGRILLLWQQVAPCNCDAEEINAFQQVIPGSVLTQERASVRERHEQKISEKVFDEWTIFVPFAHGLAVLPVSQSRPQVPALELARTACDAVALVLTPSGQEEEAERSYQWSAFIQRAGEDQFQQIPNGAIGAKPSCDRDKLRELLQCLQCWIDSELEDVPLLEIFAPDDLLHEDWGSISIEEGAVARPLHSYQPFLLRSSDRLLNRRWKKRRGALKRMHRHLVEGTGAWLPLDSTTNPETIENLDGQSQHEDAKHAVVVALYSQHSSVFKARPSWLRSVLKSMAPLVVWPSQKISLGEEQMQLCFRQLSLVREDASQAHALGIPHCPDLAHLAKARQQRSHPEVDLRGLTILVDHPDRSPDTATLQALFSSFREDPSSASEGKRPDPSTQLLISS
jgi:hypothetical protein